MEKKIVVRIYGGLGNQLFQYARAFCLGKELGREVELDLSFFSEKSKYRIARKPMILNMNIVHRKEFVDLKKLRLITFLQRPIPNNILKRLPYVSLKIGDLRYYRENLKKRFPYIKNETKIVYLDGYWQSYKYFENNRVELCEQFCFDCTSKEYLQELRNINLNNSVAVHIRHGDFKTGKKEILLKMINKYYSSFLIPIDYYHNALNKAKEINPNFHYYFFSDDIEWVKKEFGNNENYHYVSDPKLYKDEEEFMLMVNCKNFIIANSTFSYWAAWLGQFEGKMVMTPSKGYGRKDKIPKDWIKIDF